MTTVTELMNALSAHCGGANGIDAVRLAGELGVSPRRLRKLISEARNDGMAVCGLPSTGYFVPATADELDRACAFLRGRAMHTLRALRRMRVLRATLAGQLMLRQG